MITKPLKLEILTCITLLVCAFPAISNAFNQTNYTNMDVMEGSYEGIYDPVHFELIHTGFAAIGAKVFNNNSSLFHWLNLYGSNGDGTFTTLEQYVEMPDDIYYFNFTGDLNGDGYSDLITNTTSFPLTWTHTMRQSIPGGGFGDPYSFVSSDPTNVFGVCDMDGDLLPDLFGRSMGYPVVCYLNGSEEYDVVQVSSDLPCNEAYAGDLNLDGKPDMVLLNGEGEIHILQNEGARDFTSAGTIGPIPGSEPGVVHQLLLCDLTGNGYLDILSGSTPRPDQEVFHTYLNDGFMNFNYGGSFLSDLSALSPAFTAQDIDMDGCADLTVMSGYTDSSLDIYKGDGAGSFYLEPKLFSLSDVYLNSFAFGDYDCDGDLDLCCVIEQAGEHYLNCYWNTTNTAGFEGEVQSMGVLSLDVSSNPFSSEVTITASGTTFPGEIVVVDLAGRVKARIPEWGAGTYHWDGTADGGQEVSAGIYFISAEVLGCAESTVLVKLD